MGKLLRNVLFAVFGAGLLGSLLGSIFSPFTDQLVKALGINSSAWVAPMLDFLSSYWFRIAVLFIEGATIGAWSHWLATKWDRRREAKAPDPVDTRLRINFDPSGSKHFIEEYQSNVGCWQQTVVAFDAHGDQGSSSILHVDTLSLAFTVPVDYERPVVDAKGGSLGSYNFFPLGSRGAVFQFFGPIQATQIDIWFPPLGYYENKNVANKDRFSTRSGASGVVAEVSS